VGVLQKQVERLLTDLGLIEGEDAVTTNVGDERSDEYFSDIEVGLHGNHRKSEGSRSTEVINGYIFAS